MGFAMKKSLLAAAVLLAAGPVLGDNLLQVYEKAVVNDARIREARSVRDAAQELEPLARSLLLPNLSAGGTANVNRFDRKSIDFQDTYSSTTAGVSLTQAVFRRDRWMSLDRSKSQVAQAEAQLSAEEQGLIVRVATAYFDVLSAQDTLEFVRAEKKATARELDQAKQRFEVGLDAITSVHEAQSRYDITVADEVTAQFRLDQTWEALRQIIAERPASLAGLIEKIPLQPPSPDDENQWSEWAQQNNPAIQAALHAADAAKKQIEVQRSGHYPTLDAVGSYQVNRFQDVDTPGGLTSESFSDIDRGTIGLQLTIPIYQGGGVEAGTRQAVSQYQAAQDVLDGRRREVDKNVRDAYRAVNQTIARVKALKTAIVSTQSALEATQAGYEVGTRTIVDVLNRQRDLFAAQRDYAVARYQHLIASLSLKQAAGNVTREDVQQVNALLK
jgi:outer membrane protein